MLRDDDSVALIDFGISHSAHVGQSRPPTRRSPEIAGTPYYMSPEQARRRRDGRAHGPLLARRDPLSDADGREALRRGHDRRDPRPAPQRRVAACSRAELGAYQPLLNKLLAKDPSQRFGSAREAARSVGANARHPRARPARSRCPRWRASRRRPRGSRSRTESRSARCDGVTFCRLRNSRSVRPGSCCSHPASMALISRRFMLSCEPHRLHGNDRELAAARVARDFALGAIRERPDHDVLAVVALQLRRHRFQASAEEHVQEQRLDDVVAMVAERDLGGAELVGDAVENAAAQPRAQPAHRLAGLDDARDDRVRVLRRRCGARTPRSVR